MACVTRDHLSLASLPCTVITTGDGLRDPAGAGAGAASNCTGASFGEYGADTLADALFEDAARAWGSENVDDDAQSCKSIESCTPSHTSG